MKYGVPVVATPLAVEGMFPKDGEDCLVAASAQEFASKVVQAYTDWGLWERLVRGGHRNVKLHFSLERAKAMTLQVRRGNGVDGGVVIGAVLGGEEVKGTAPESCQGWGGGRGCIRQEVCMRKVGRMQGKLGICAGQPSDRAGDAQAAYDSSAPSAHQASRDWVLVNACAVQVFASAGVPPRPSWARGKC